MRQNDMSTLRARALRQTLTPAERILWHALRDRRFLGLKFRRQVPIGPYIADFFCAEHRLVVEADGGQHALSTTDADRDHWLAEHRFRTLRFWNDEVLTNLPGVLQRLTEEIAR